MTTNRDIAPGVRVKALEWLDTGSGYYARADLCQRFYSIGAEEGKFWANWDASIPPFLTIEAARAAAQADYEGRIRAALEVEERTFPMGDMVRKLSGSWWEGRVVGFYSTEQTPDGVCVQLDKPMGPVQIYPASALCTLPAGASHG